MRGGAVLLACLIAGCGPRQPIPSQEPQAAPTVSTGWPSHPIVLPYPWPDEWTPILYATVPNLTTSGQEFSKATLLGGVQPAYSRLTYKLYQVNLSLLNQGNSSCCTLLSDAVTPGFTIKALLRYGACFVLTQEPSMAMGEMLINIKDRTMVWTNEGFAPLTDPATHQGRGAGGIPSGPGMQPCASPPPINSAADAATAYVTIVVN